MLSLTNPDVLDPICEQWSKDRDKFLEQLLCQKKYVARKPIALRVLTALKVARLEVVRDGSKEIVETLLKALKIKILRSLIGLINVLFLLPILMP